MRERAPRLLSHEPAPGMVLVALPMLTDPNFVRSLIYLLESDLEAGSAGVVINSPTRTPVGSVLPDWHDVMSRPGVVFRGGPVQPDGALCLATVTASPAEAPQGSIRLVRQRTAAARVGLVDLDADVEEIRAAVSDLRVFAGHAGWAAGQLEAEIAQGAWWVVPSRIDDVFAADPARLWSRVLRRQPFPVNLLASYPEDPTLN
ncbi:MAG: YqgE/AlgH family protein [bacterium]